jgi:hypothetical protein
MYGRCRRHGQLLIFCRQMLVLTPAVLQVKERRIASKRIVSRMLHTHLAAAFDGFAEAVEQLAAHRQTVLRAVRSLAEQGRAGQSRAEQRRAG